MLDEKFSRQWTSVVPNSNVAPLKIPSQEKEVESCIRLFSLISWKFVERTIVTRTEFHKYCDWYTFKIQTIWKCNHWIIDGCITFIKWEYHKRMQVSFDSYGGRKETLENVSMRSKWWNTYLVRNHHQVAQTILWEKLRKIFMNLTRQKLLTLFFKLLCGWLFEISENGWWSIFSFVWFARSSFKRRIAYMYYWMN